MGGRTFVPSMVLLHPSPAQMDWDLGGLETKTKPWSVLHAPRSHFLIMLVFLWGIFSRLGEGHTVERDAAVGGCAWSAIMFRYISRQNIALEQGDH